MNWLNSDNIELFLKKFVDFVPEVKIENTFFSLFQTDLTNEIQYQFAYLKQANLQPSEIKQMEFWEWQMMIEELKNYIEKEKEEREKAEGKDGMKNNKYMQDANSQMKGMGVDPDRISKGGGMSKMPNLGSGGFKLPKI